MLKTKLTFLFFFFVVFLIFHSWLDIGKNLSSGDWPYLYAENVTEFQVLKSPFLWLEPYYQVTAKIGTEILNLKWEMVEKIFWFIPIIFLNILSSFLFLKYILRKLKIQNIFFLLLGSLFYSTNTYFLMLSGGGQMGVAFAYSLAPLVLLFSIRTFEEKASPKLFLMSTFCLSVQLMFDPRIFLITTFASFIYFAFNFRLTNDKGKNILRILGVFSVSFILNLFWIIPNLSAYKQEYTLFATEPLASFLSFASFSNTISLLHPNWPENIFGKVYFMRPEFIILPILIFSGLLFIGRKNLTIKQSEKQIILFFAFLALLGAFLSKGVNGPFGEFYVFFSSLPGSSIFRDPTKFYILICLSYSVLLPFSAEKLYAFLRSKTQFPILNFKLSNKSKLFNLQNLSLILVVSYLIFLLKPAFLGELSGTFKPQSVPAEYVRLKDFFLSHEEPFSYISVPSVQRFSFSSSKVVGISATDIFQADNVSSVPAMLVSNPEKLSELNVRYVIVPYDSRGEIFLTDRKYDESFYLKTVENLRQAPWLTESVDESRKESFGRIYLFKVKEIDK